MIQKIILDTGTWMKLDKLMNVNIISKKFIDKLYQIVDIAITPEIEQELIAHKVISYQKNKTFIIPISNSKLYTRVRNDNFDKADASIIGINNIQEYLIISEDRPLNKYYKMYNLTIMFFADFIWVLLKEGMISKNKAYRLLKPFQEIRNIPKDKYKKLLKKIQLF